MVTEKEKEMIRLLSGTLNALGMDKDTILIIVEAMYHHIELMDKLMHYIANHPTATADEAEAEAVRLLNTPIN